ncbi:MAG: toll/interleukin-1 receptor domain-containing protein [Bacteroidales bacterium]|nr:toll/interleukin-1 receptor domain-containing protein [Bacteroidales bacterium]MEE0992292.1 toll/interleukin-1 receptor domain-containing protein [Bacteroidales bacterium]
MSGKNFDVFISYRRSDGTDKARVLDLAFKEAGLRTFLDFNSIAGGSFEQRIEVAIKDAAVFVMVMTPDYFARCNEEGDWVRKEIELALANEKTIIPINIDGKLNSVPDYLDEDFRNRISCYNFAIVYMDSAFQSCLDHIIERIAESTIKNLKNPNRDIITQEEKASVAVKSDADCELIKNNEIIATVQQDQASFILLEKGRHRIIARSAEYPDISIEVIKEITDVSFVDFILIRLSDRIRRREEEEARCERMAPRREEEEEERRRMEMERRRKEMEEAERILPKPTERSKSFLGRFFGIFSKNKYSNSSIRIKETKQKDDYESIQDGYERGLGKNYDIFISYRRKDGKEIARLFNKMLKSKGYRCFLDYESLGTGEFPEKIKEAIEDAPFFMMIMTPKYFKKVNSKSSWVRREIDLALENKKLIVPINYDDKVSRVPRYVKKNFRDRISPHNFSTVYSNDTFNATFELMLKKRIQNEFGILPDTRDKAKIEVYSDTNCEILKGGEVIATVFEREYNFIRLGIGKHWLVCRSLENKQLTKEKEIVVTEALGDDYVRFVFN